MKIFTLFFTLFFFNNMLFSQEKLTVGILPFSTQNNIDAKDAIVIQEKISNSFLKLKRYNVLDSNKLLTTGENQKKIGTIDQSILEQAKKLGARQIIQGKIISVNKSKTSKERIRINGTLENYDVFDVKINFVCEIINVENGEVINIENFNSEAVNINILGYTGPKSMDEAFVNALNSIQNSIDKWIVENFPLSLVVVEVQEKDSKGRPKSILIAGGSSLGLEKGEKLVIVESVIVDVDGVKKERKRELAVIKIVKIEDENFSSCNVISGGSEIIVKLESKSKLFAVTIK